MKAAVDSGDLWATMINATEPRSKIPLCKEVDTVLEYAVAILDRYSDLHPPL